MGYSKEIYRATKAKMEERRTKAERRAEQVREEVYRRVPRIEELEKEYLHAEYLRFVRF